MSRLRVLRDWDVEPYSELGSLGGNLVQDYRVVLYDITVSYQDIGSDALSEMQLKLLLVANEQEYNEAVYPGTQDVRNFLLNMLGQSNLISWRTNHIEEANNAYLPQDCAWEVVANTLGYQQLPSIWIVQPGVNPNTGEVIPTALRMIEKHDKQLHNTIRQLYDGCLELDTEDAYTDPDPYGEGPESFKELEYYVMYLAGTDDPYDLGIETVK